jgi:hypothetical protein
MAQDEKPATPVGTDLDAEQTNAIGGGLSCNADELVRLTESLKQAYDNLVDFASHVIERVAGPNP